MTKRQGGDLAARVVYEIRIREWINQERWAVWFGDMTITHEAGSDDSASTLRCAVADQAALHGILAKIRDLNLTLTSVRRVLPSRLEEQGDS